METCKIAVIGSGFAGLAAASLLARQGHQVTIFEKNDQPGGRARVWEKDGFRFDMGPSWYWMPDVFEDYFGLFDKKPSDFYQLQQLDPSYRVYFAKNDFIDIPASFNQLQQIFEQLEPGSSAKLSQFIEQARYKYEAGMKDFVFRPSNSFKEYLDFNLLKKSFQLQLLSSMSKHVKSFFKNEKLIKILEFPVLFLGATPQKTPALYSLMNYADLLLGTWYPLKGMNEIVKAMVSLAVDNGVEIKLNAEVKNIRIKNQKASGIETDSDFFPADVVVSNADYQFTDQHLLEKSYRNYSESYWQKRALSPSALLFYIGLNKKIGNLQHHNLFFDEDFNRHAYEIYTSPQWPSKPLFYVSCPSKTDPSVAPEGCENLFLLMPLAPGLNDNEELRESYYHLMMQRLENITSENIKNSVIVKRSFCLNDFISDYYSFKGNAYGLANTLLQTAFLKPKMRSKKVKNLFYTGQLTIPGPGVPPALISGQVVAKEVEKYLKRLKG